MSKNKRLINKYEKSIRSEYNMSDEDLINTTIGLLDILEVTESHITLGVLSTGQTQRLTIEDFKYRMSAKQT